MLPAQYEQDRILKQDIQEFLQKVNVKEDPALSDRFPAEMAIKLEIETNDGQVYTVEKDDYQGFTSRPASWDILLEKYHLLTQGIDRDLADKIANSIANLENIDVTELTELLAQV